jgi:predicted DNA binding CopG/RHH family protein
MKRVNFHLTEQQITRLKKMSAETGLTVAELIRRAIDAYSVQWNIGEKITEGHKSE